MVGFIFVVVLFLSLIVGVFGFSQIIGTIKYFNTFSAFSALFTIILWGGILGFGAYAVIAWINYAKVALYIGYGISFLLSLSTKPDTPAKPINTNVGNNNFISNDDYAIDTSFMSEEDKKEVEGINEIISTLVDTYNNAVRDLGDYTLEDANSAYKNGFMNKERYIELKNAIESLTFVKEVYPEKILEMKEKRNEILKKYE